MRSLVTPQPTRSDHACGAGRECDAEHLEGRRLEDDQPGRDGGQQRDADDEIAGQRRRSEGRSIEQRACLDDPRARRPDLEFAGPPGKHVGIVGKEAPGAISLRSGLDAPWVIIGRLVSHLGQRLAATVVALWVTAITALNVFADAQPDSTWIALKALPHQGRVAVLALAVDPANKQAVIAGTSDGSMLRSTNGGGSWTVVHTGKTNVTTIAFSPVKPGLVLAGTHAGGLASRDGGATWSPTPGLEGRNVHVFAFALALVAAGTDRGVYVSSGGLLPTTDYTQVSFITDHHDHFYAASDGGGSGSGGLWRTNDGGRSFNSMEPPEASVTALAVSNDEQPTLYVATFEPSSHIPHVWTFHDTGGTPQGPIAAESPAASGARPAHAKDTSMLSQILGSPQLPYLGLGLGALAVILTAIAAHLRARTR